MPSRPKLIIAGYPAAPTEKSAQLAYYERLTSVRAADGLQFGWGGRFSAADLDDALAVLPDHWVVTLNSVPATLAALRADPKFGLASPDDAARAAAVALGAELAASVRAINSSLGRPAVLAVEINSAPASVEGGVQPAPGAFAQSLEELAAMDWSGAEVLVEHCDAHIRGQVQSKGFMSLTDELLVLGSLAGFGLSLNWGRSLLELRDPDRVIDHITESAASGLLRGVTLSGAGAVDSSYGPAWSDAHLPFADPLEARYCEPTSLLTRARAREALDALDEWDGLFVAVKTQWLPGRVDPVERAASVVANFETLHALMIENHGFGGGH